MKRTAFILALLLAAGGATASAQQPISKTVVTMDTPTPSLDYVDFFFNGYTIKVPQGMPVNMDGNEAVVKSADGTFGLSIKIEKDAKASANGAYELCKRVVTDLHLQEAKLTKVNINGLEGACVEGNLEGMHVGVEVLDGGKRYIKAIAIFDASHTDAAKQALMSIRKD